MIYSGHERSIAPPEFQQVPWINKPCDREVLLAALTRAATLLRLAHEVPNIVGLKDAAGNPGETAAVISSAPNGFEVYSGDDSLTLPLMASGAIGVIGVATHWTGEDHQLMFDLWEKGDIAGARLVNSRMLESFAFEGAKLFRGAAIGGLVMVLVTTGFSVLMAVLFNLISDLTGGIRVSVIELENLRQPAQTDRSA